jgi:hypothetical protein
MTRTKSRRRFPSDGCPGPLGDPLVCAPFLDDGMIRVQLNQASSQRTESAGQGHGGGASSPSPLAGEGRGGGSTSRAASTSRVHEPHLDEMHGPGIPALSPQSRDAAQTDARRRGCEFGKPHLPADLLAKPPSPAPPAARRGTEVGGRSVKSKKHRFHDNLHHPKPIPAWKMRICASNLCA